MKVLIATHNPAKFQRYRKLLEDIVGIDLISLADLGISKKVEEKYDNARDNSVYKAREYAKLSSIITLSIDESLRTNFLTEGEEPGTYIRRYKDKKENLTDLEILVLWKDILTKYQQKDKKLTWDFFISMYNPDKMKTHTWKVVQRAVVSDKFSRIILPGYPMSSFMILEGSDRPHSDLTEEEKLDLDRIIFRNFISEFEKTVLLENS